MAALSNTEIIEILTRGEFQKLVGVEESETLDFKELYSKQNPSMPADLVADVASFANSGGGIIVEGVKCEKSETSRIEVVDEIVGVEPEQIDVDQRWKLIRAHVHPLVSGLEFRWYPPLEDQAQIRLLATVIGPQKEHEKPFIVDIVVRDKDDNSKAVKNAFGWPTRSGADTHWTHAARVQQMICEGLRRWISAPVPTTPVPTHADEAMAQLDIIEQLEEWDQWGGIVIQCLPPGTERIPDFFGSFNRTVHEWSSERTHGFDLPITWDSPAAVSGRLIGEEAGRTALIVSKAGVVSAGALANPEFLGWAMKESWSSQAPGRMIISPIPLVEFVTETLRFAYDCVGAHVGREGWELRAIGIHLADRVPVALNQRRANSPYPPLLHPATDNDFRVVVEGTGNAYKDAATLLGEIYGDAFGLGADQVPYVEDGAVNLGLMN